MQILIYTKRILQNIIKSHKAFFVLILVSVTGAVLCLLFSYGLFLNTEQTVGEIEEDSTIFSYYWNEDARLNRELSEGLNALISKYKDEITEIDIYMTLTDKNGEPQNASAWYFSDGSGLFSDAGRAICRVPIALNVLVNDGRITLNNIEFEVDTEHSQDRIVVPFNMIPDGSRPTSMLIFTKERPTKSKIKSFNEAVSEQLSAECDRAPGAIDLMEYQLNNAFYLYAFVIVCIVLLDLSMYIRYLLQLKRKMMRILSVCGASRAEISAIFILSNMILLCVGCLIAFSLFRFRLLDICKGIYKDFGSYYDSKAYLSIFCIYMLTSLVILAVMVIPIVSSGVSAGERRERA